MSTLTLHCLFLRTSVVGHMTPESSSFCRCMCALNQCLVTFTFDLNVAQLVTLVMGSLYTRHVIYMHMNRQQIAISNSALV